MDDFFHKKCTSWRPGHFLKIKIKIAEELLFRWKKDKIGWRQQDDIEPYLFNDRAFQGYKFI